MPKNPPSLLAAWSILTVALLTCSPAFSQTIGTVTVLTNERGNSIPSGFLGLSHEWEDAQTMMGHTSKGVNPIYRQLLNNLTAYGSGPMIIRIGGGSTDASGEPTAGIVEPFAELANDTNAKFYLGVNLGANNVNLAEAQAKAYISGMPSGSLLGLEIGNEPDNYFQNDFRPPNYNYQDYLADFNTWKEHIQPLLPSGTRLMGPSWACTCTLGWYAEPFGSSEASALANMSQHYYVGDGRADNPEDILLMPASATAAPSQMAPGITAAHDLNVPFRIGEMNSLYNGGEAGISNTFQSALWAIDTMFWSAHYGVDGVNWHTASTGYYAPFNFNIHYAAINTYSLASVNPEYYGLLFFQAATGNGSHLVPNKLITTANLTAWATEDASGVERVVLIKKDKLATGTVSVTIPGFSVAKVYSLTAPSYQSRSGVKFAGQTFDGSTNGVFQGTQSVETVYGSNGVFPIPITTTSAALVVFEN